MLCFLHSPVAALQGMGANYRKGELTEAERAIISGAGFFSPRLRSINTFEVESEATFSLSFGSNKSKYGAPGK